MAEQSKMVGNYPFVGDNYRQHGEVPGYIYYPWNDQYYADPAAVRQYQQQNNLVEPEAKAPGLLSSLAPVAGAGLAMGVGQGLAKDPTGFLGGIKDAASGLFGLGGKETVATEAANVAASAPVAEATTTTGSGLFNLGATAPEAVATSAQSGLPATAGELVGSQAPTTGLSLGGIASNAASMGALPVAGILGGTALGVKGAIDTLKGDDTKGLLDWGSRATIGIATGGLSEGYRALDGIFGSKDRWKTEGNKLNALADQGVYVPDNLLAEMPTGPRSKEELTRQDLATDFVGRDDAGGWVNNKFAQSRDVADLRPEDIVNYATFAEKDPQWFNKPLDERLQIAQQALDAGAVSEGRGSVQVDWKKLEKPKDEAAG